jgi:hypothetical protein
MDTKPGTPTAIKTPKTREIDLWAETLNAGRHFPWFSPVESTPELVSLAGAIESGGMDLITEIEG